MGVQGLWTLLHPTGRPVTLESLEGKILAIDVSIWLNQAIKGQRDRQGNQIVNPHLVTLFNRVCKLLHYRIKPIFVFDGAAPSLKKRTIAARRLRKLEATNVSEKTTRRLLQNLMKQHAVGALSQGDVVPDEFGSNESSPAPSRVPLVGMGVGSGRGRKKTAGEDLFKLAPLPEPDKVNYEDEEDDGIVLGEAQIDTLMYLQSQDLESIDPYSEEFKLLPLEVQHEVLMEVKLGRKDKRSHNLDHLPQDSGDFMSFQLKKIMKHSKISNRIDDLRKELNANLSGEVAANLSKNKVASEVVSRKLASEDSAHFVLLKGLRPVEVESEPTKLVEEMQRKSKVMGMLNKCQTSADLEFAKLSKAAGYGKPNGDETKGVKRKFEEEESEDSCSVSERVTPDSITPVGSPSKKQREVVLSSDDSEDEVSVVKTVKTQVHKPTVDLTKELDLFKVDKNRAQEIDEDYREDDVDPEIIFESYKESEKGQIVDTKEKNEAGEIYMKADRTDKQAAIEIESESEDHNDADDSIEMCEDVNPKTTSEQKNLNNDIKVDEPKPETDSVVSQPTIDNSSPCKDTVITPTKPIDSPRKKMLDEIKAKLAAEKARLKAQIESESIGDVTPPRPKLNPLEEIKAKLAAEKERLKAKIASNSSELLVSSSPLLGVENEPLQMESDIEITAFTTNESNDTSQSNTVKVEPLSPESNTSDVIEVDTTNSMTNHESKDTHQAIAVNDSTSSKDRSPDAPDVIAIQVPKSPVEDELFPSQMFTDEPDIPKIQSSNDEPDVEQVQSPKKTSARVPDPETRYGETEDSASIYNDRALMEQYQASLETEHRELVREQDRQTRMAATVTDQMYSDAQDLLQLFGIPFIISPQEAEAQCAFLDLSKQTDGTITDDSDVWLFGGERVYKNFFNQNKVVEYYTSLSIEHQIMLNRQKLINIALLCGSDYTEGIQGIGPVSAMEIMAEFPGQDIDGLLTFKEWWKSIKEHPNQPCSTIKKKFKHLQIKESFPSLEVIDAYLEPVVDESKEAFSWGNPDLDLLRNFAYEKLGWVQNKADEMLVPMMKQLNRRDTQSSITKFFTQRFGEPAKNKSKRLQQTLDTMRAGANSTSSNTEASEPAPTKTVSATSSKGKAGGKLKPKGKSVVRTDAVAKSSGFVQAPSSLPTELNLSESSSDSEADSDSDLLKAVEEAEAKLVQEAKSKSCPVTLSAKLAGSKGKRGGKTRGRGRGRGRKK